MPNLSATAIALTADGLQKWVRSDLNLLQDISLAIQPNELVVIVGQSGGGKSTLLDALSGYRPATHGRVFANQAAVYQNFDAVRTLIGYVPQREIIHMELNVYQALDYAAQLRLPRGTTPDERRVRVEEVLGELDLAHRKDAPVRSLSGGQQKRVSIGVELLTRPRLFFLDEPTSGLDPGTETALMRLLRRLADQGRTILLVTHATKNVMLADKVIFLARGGYLAWFGPPREALAYFDEFRTAAERALRPIEFDDLYALLEDPGLGEAQDWADRYRANPAFAAYIQKPLQAQRLNAGLRPGLAERLAQARDNYRSQIRPLHQFLVLSSRNLRILARDRASLILMLLVPPLVACLDLLLAPLMGRKIFDFYAGAPVSASQSLFLLTLYTLMVSSLSQMREIVKENAIYRRERLVNLRVIPYVFSKVWVAVLLAAYHALAYTLVHYTAFEMPGGTVEAGLAYVTLLLASLAGMLLGLLASALAPNSSTAPMITLLFILPNIVLSGALVSVPGYISAPSSSHWAFRGLVAISGLGADLAADDCWLYPPELRSAMTLDDKATLGCRCMGVNVFNPELCDFPGTGRFYTPEIDQPAPLPPSELSAPPGELVLPPAPPGPADAYDKVAVAAYLNELQAYQVEVTRLQNEFKTQMAAYQNVSRLYQSQMQYYQSELSRWFVARSAAVGAAEGNLAALNERFGWAFVSREDPGIFRAAVVRTWQAQGVICIILIGITLLAVKRKDRAS